MPDLVRPARVVQVAVRVHRVAAPEDGRQSAAHLRKRELWPLLMAVARRPMLPGAYAESDHASSAAHRRAVYYSRRVGQERSQVVGARDRVLLCFCRRRDDGVELGVKHSGGERSM